MKCSCCGKKKRILESFEELTTEVSVCVECSKKLYKYQDFKKDKLDADAEKMLIEIKSKKNSTKFTEWLETFLARFIKQKPDDNSEEISTDKIEIE